MQSTRARCGARSRRCSRRCSGAKGLEGFTWLGHHLLSVDGAGYFSSHSVHCDNCCGKRRRDGQITHHRQMLGAVLAHPQRREAFPLAPEPIMRKDGSRRNDCERNAAKRLLRDARREHPHLKLLVAEDAPASNGPSIRLLNDLDMRFVLGAKPGDHAELFRWVDATPTPRTVETVGDDSARTRFRFLNGVPLNDANFDSEVNFLECWETPPNGRERHFSWVTDLMIDESNVHALMRAGRARWRIGNETFNTLRNQGCGFERNFGRGKRHLATVFAQLTMMAFLIDQAQQRCRALFRAAQGKAGRAKCFRERLRSLFLEFLAPDWGTPRRAVAFGHRTESAPFDTS